MSLREQINSTKTRMGASLTDDIKAKLGQAGREIAATGLVDKIPKVGEKAPDFTLPDQDGKSHSLSDYRGITVLLYFYPKDNTPGCTLQAKAFTEHLNDFISLGATILGISGGDEKSKQKFCEQHALEVTLLSDTDFAVAKKYGVYGKKTMMGKEFMGIERVTFILDENRDIVKVLKDVKPEKHAEEALQFLRKKEQK